MRRVLGRTFHNHHDESKDERSVRGDSSARGNQEQICEIIVEGGKICSVKNKEQVTGLHQGGSTESISL